MSSAWEFARSDPRPAVWARLAINLPSQAGREDWFPVHLAAVADGYRAEPVFGKSNLIFHLAQADGLVRIPADANGLAAGELVEVYLYVRGFMSVYLHDIPLPQAQARFEQALEESGLCDRLGVEEIPLDENALGCVLAEPVWAIISSPHYHASAMDGFAVALAGYRRGDANRPNHSALWRAGSVRGYRGSIAGLGKCGHPD